jgi:hypothetical protein
MLGLAGVPAQGETMHARTLRGLLAAAALLTLAHARADLAAPRCEIPGSEAGLLADRAGLLAQYRRLPTPCLQQIFRACTEEADRSLLDLGSAAVCSLSYEALLQQEFGGSFPALLAWWRTGQDQP